MSVDLGNFKVRCLLFQNLLPTHVHVLHVRSFGTVSKNRGFLLFQNLPTLYTYIFIVHEPTFHVNVLAIFVLPILDAICHWIHFIPSDYCIAFTIPSDSIKNYHKRYNFSFKTHLCCSFSFNDYDYKKYNSPLSLLLF